VKGVSGGGADPPSTDRTDGGVAERLPHPVLGDVARLIRSPGWQIVLGSALGVALLLLAARDVDWAEVRSGILRADPRWVAVSLSTVLLTTAAKVARWVGLFPAGGRPGLPSLTRALLGGQLANAVLPARVGELARAYVVGAAEEISNATALGTIAAEKAFDVLFLLVCAGVAAALTPLPRWLDLGLAGMAAVGLLLVLLALVSPERTFGAWFRRWGHLVPWGIGEWLAGVVQRGLAGLVSLRRPRMALTACAWSAVIWTLAAGTNYLLFRAFDLRLPVGAAVFLLVLLHVGVAPPSSPGRLGVFHALTVLGLEAFAVDRSASLAYATVLHAIVYLPQVLLGAVALILGRRG
jgi:uncharacterized membrane protein YbhN (UPF0104 family)